jgi:CheY-like chemotaxis protein
MVPANPKVLVIEDDDDVRAEVGAALARSGYQIVAAAHGAEAIDLLEAAPIPYCAIVLDWMMPVLDGLGFLSFQASHPRHAVIPVVVLSAVARPGMIPSLCVARVLPKPVRATELVAAIDRVCGVIRAVRDARGVIAAHDPRVARG